MVHTVPPVSAADRALANLFGTPDKALNTPVESAADADEALNRNKVERADGRAIYDQAMLNTLLGSSL